MLLRLVRTYLRPYAAPLAAVVALQFVGTTDERVEQSTPRTIGKVQAVRG